MFSIVNKHHHQIFYHRNYPTDNSPDEDEWPDEIVNLRSGRCEFGGPVEN